MSATNPLIPGIVQGTAQIVLIIMAIDMAVGIMDDITLMVVSSGAMMEAEDHKSRLYMFSIHDCNYMDACEFQSIITEVE